MVGAATRMRAEEEYPEIIANVVIRRPRAEGPATVHPVLGDSDGARPSRHVVPLGGDRAGRMPLEQRAKMDALRHLAEDGRQEVIDQHSRYRIPPSAMPMCVSLRRQYFTGHNAGMAQFTDQDTAGVVAPPPLIYLSGLVSGLALQRVFNAPRLPAAIRWLGLPCIGVGGLIIGLAVRELRRADTELDPSKPTTVIVSSGPYARSRNPIYLGLSAIYLGLSLLARSTTALLLLWPILAVMRWGVIAREERYLEHKFSEAYPAYRGRVRRWL